MNTEPPNNNRVEAHRAFWDAVHRELLARTWQPDQWGKHDKLTRHPYTGELGCVIVQPYNNRVVRLWMTEQELRDKAPKPEQAEGLRQLMPERAADAVRLNGLVRQM